MNEETPETDGVTFDLESDFVEADFARALERRNHRLEEALKPFAALASFTEVLSPDMEIEQTIRYCERPLTIGDLRKAREALAEQKEKP